MTLYNSYDLIIYLYIYSFFGWCLQTLYYYIAEGSLKNRSLLNQPLILTYGITMLSLILGSGLSQEHMVLQFIMNILRVLLIKAVAEVICEKISGGPLVRERKEKRSLREFFLHDGERMIEILLIATVIFTAFKILHPIVYLAISLLPFLLTQILSAVCAVSILLDLLLVILAARKVRALPLAAQWESRQSKISLTLIYRIGYAFRKRLLNTYPDLKKYTDDYEGAEEIEFAAKRQGIVFAQGIGFYKLVWVFFITSLLGDFIETIYVWLRGAGWMRRSGVVFGPFSIVWGIGAALLSLILYRFAKKKKIHIFIGGFLLGGTYEYMASVVLEALFHTKFWDYSQMPLNIGGRTNIWYMFGWGFLALVWIGICYPVMSKLIEKMPPILGAVTTWGVIIFMVLNLAVTGMVMLRYNQRKHDATARNQIEYYIDEYYNDATVERMWPNLTSTESGRGGE